MKMNRQFISLTAIAFAFSVQAKAAAVKYLPGDYNVDPAHTRIEFVVPHLVISEVEGRFNDVSGSFTLGKTISNSKVEATIKTASVDTAVTKRDDDLKGEKFLDVAKYPTMTFKSTKITGSNDNFKMVGDLTIKDVTKQVTFEGKYLGSLKDPWGMQRVALMAKTHINRQDFHLTYNEMSELGSAVGNEVTIILRAEGTMKTAGK